MIYQIQVPKNHLIQNGRKWQSMKFIKSQFFFKFFPIKTDCCRYPPFNSNFDNSNNLWSFFIKIKGISFFFELMKMFNSNKFEIYPIQKNLFFRIYSESNKYFQILNLNQNRNMVLNQRTKKRIVIITKHSNEKLRFLKLNSGIVFSEKKENRGKIEFSLNKKIILSTW